MLTIRGSKDYTWELTSAGKPDMRKARNRQNVYEMAHQLELKLKESESKNKILQTKDTMKTDNICAICTEEMQGVSILRCGHSMCASCFAQHSRVSHTCPFCRDEFAPKPKKQRERIPAEVRDAMANHWSNCTRNQGYFKMMEERMHTKPTIHARQKFLEWLVRENGKILMQKVSQWYDADA